MTIESEIIRLVRRTPGLTERDLAQALFGRAAYQQRVNPICRSLVASGTLKRHGLGGPGNPYTYSAVGSSPA